VRPRRAFLDSCILKRLSHGEWREAGEALHRRTQEGEIAVLVTPDHLSDYVDCSDQLDAIREAGYVDTFCPLWMCSGEGIYHREAYSEYLLLTGGAPLPPPFPTRAFPDCLLQWARDCPCDAAWVRSWGGGYVREDEGAFSHVVRLGFEHDQSGHSPTLLQRRGEKELCAGNLQGARAQELSTYQLDAHFRRAWVRVLSMPPARAPEGDLAMLAARVEFDRMPAWRVRIAVETQWLKSQTKPKASDVIDRRHLALLPYVDAFVAEKNMVGLIRQAKVQGGTSVGASNEDWPSLVGIRSTDDS